MFGWMAGSTDKVVVCGPWPTVVACTEDIAACCRYGGRRSTARLYSDETGDEISFLRCDASKILILAHEAR